ncbi:TPA: hypothetical protein ACOFD8_000581 [Stenotrophomonas maltophilia]
MGEQHIQSTSPATLFAKRLAIADPPYPPFSGSGGIKNRASRWYGYGQRSAKDKPADRHPEADTWDSPKRHRQLLEELLCGYDGFVIATSLDGIAAYGELPAAARIAIWHRANANPGAHRIRTTCEAVIVYPPEGRRSNRSGVGMVPDHLSVPVPRGGFTGMKPDAWVDWVLDMLTYTPGDLVVDLFPGSGQVGRAVARRQVLEVSNG